MRDGTCVLATDGRYVEQARGEAPDVELLVTRAPGPDAVVRAAASGAGALGIEDHVVTLAVHRRLLAVAGDMRLAEAGLLVEAARRVKDAREIETLRRACGVTADVFAEVAATLRPGRTEREVAWQMATSMRERGADGPAFPSIVAFGSHSSIPHHTPTDRPLETGDLVKLDFGASVDGYAADMTRTVVVGTAADWQAELHAQVLETQAAARATVRPGAVPRGLDADCRQRLEAAGHQSVHGLGHGVGLEVHEAPMLTAESTDAALAVGETVTIEPGAYLPGRGGVRIEDVVLVEEMGGVALTNAPRELLSVG
jgi:Xaa-Pro aminopeptidase